MSHWNGTEAIRQMTDKGSSGEVLVPSLNYYRRRLALSQENLAEKAHVAKSTIRRGEQGLPVRPSSVQKLARALHVKPWELQQPAPDVNA